jgi:hypothetical protein
VAGRFTKKAEHAAIGGRCYPKIWTNMNSALPRSGMWGKRQRSTRAGSTAQIAVGLAVAEHSLALVLGNLHNDIAP